MTESCQRLATTTLPDDFATNPPDGSLDPSRYYPDQAAPPTEGPPTNTVKSDWFRSTCSSAAYRVLEDGRIEVDDGTHSFIPDGTSRWAPAVEKWRDIITRASSQNGVPEALIAGVMDIESGGDPNAGSSAGAVGLMQLMPGTIPGATREQMLDPEWNTMHGAAELAAKIKKYHGNYALALAAYNLGHTECFKDPTTCPSDPWRLKTDCGYVSKVLAAYNTAITKGFPPSYAVSLGKTDTIAPDYRPTYTALEALASIALGMIAGWGGAKLYRAATKGR
jgi:hypothetical protein